MRGVIQPQRVQYLAGHRYISSTESYLENEMEGLIEEVQQFHPLGLKQIIFNIVYLYHSGTHNFKTMLVISSREFRQNQKMYFEKADKGEQIIVQRGKDRAYALTPVGEEDMYFNAEMVERIKESLKQVESGKTKKISTSQEINELLGL